MGKIIWNLIWFLIFPGDSHDKESTCNAEVLGSIPWVRKIPWRREWQPTLVLLPGEFHGQRILVVYSLWGHKESDTTERLTTATTNSLCCITFRLLYYCKFIPLISLTYFTHLSHMSPTASPPLPATPLFSASMNLFLALLFCFLFYLCDISYLWCKVFGFL